MEVLHQAVLRHVLEKEDAVLGPWLLGRDTAEDELHAFAGVCVFVCACVCVCVCVTLL